MRVNKKVGGVAVSYVKSRKSRYEIELIYGPYAHLYGLPWWLHRLGLAPSKFYGTFSCLVVPDC